MQRLVVVVVLGLSSLAHAGDSKAWTAAKKILPGKLALIVGVNVGTLRGSDLYKQLAPLVLAKKADVQSRMQEVKEVCGSDVSGFIDSAVAGVDENGKGAVVIALRSWTQKDVESCLTKMAKAQSVKLTTEKAGDFTHYH